MIPTRTVWFAAGVLSGAAGTVYGYARYREARGRFAADRLADTVSESALRSARNLRGTVLQAFDEGRDAMGEAEERIRSDLAPRPGSDHLTPVRDTPRSAVSRSQ